MKIVFVDQYRSAFLHEIAKYKIGSAWVGDVRQWSMMHNVAFVSPANSFLCMDGGIDRAYADMFPGIGDVLQQRLRSRNHEPGERPSLPVGSAIVNQVKPTVYLVSAPTMFLPRNVSETDNAYRSFLAVLRVLKDANLICKLEYLVIPALCGGIGGMSGTQVASQIARAYQGEMVKYSQ